MLVGRLLHCSSSRRNRAVDRGGVADGIDARGGAQRGREGSAGRPGEHRADRVVARDDRAARRRHQAARRWPGCRRPRRKPGTTGPRRARRSRFRPQLQNRRPRRRIRSRTRQRETPLRTTTTGPTPCSWFLLGKWKESKGTGRELDRSIDPSVTPKQCRRCITGSGESCHGAASRDRVGRADQVCTVVANRRSSAAAGSSHSPACGADGCTTVLRGVDSQWKRSDGDRRAIGPAAGSPAQTARTASSCARDARRGRRRAPARAGAPRRARCDSRGTPPPDRTGSRPR